MTITQHAGFVLSLVACLSACAVGPDFRRPDVAQSDAYSMNAPLTADATQRFHVGADVPAQWWRSFGSAELNAAVDAALAASPTLEQASARLRQTQESYNAMSGATEYPAVDLDVSAVRQKVNPAAAGVPVRAPAPFNVFNASVDVSYTFDVFGGNRRALEGLAAQVDYQRFELDAARQTLAANVAINVIRQAGVRAQIDATQRMLEAQSQQLAIMQERLRLGGVAAVDVKNQSLLVAQTRANLPPLQQQAASLRHMLATYMGVSPGALDFTLPSFAALMLPTDLPVSLPSTLARQRPDIRAAEALWHQASADVGVATANLYPQFTLTGSLGTSRTRADDLANGLNVWNIGARLMQPIFHGGQLRAQKRGAEAAYDAAAASYRQTVLGALQQVADVLQALQNDALSIQARTDAMMLADDVHRTVSAQYTLGGVSHLALLDAQRQRAQAERDLVGAAADRMADTAALFQALGGEWAP